ncbi:MAG: hypothetical protein P1R74_16230, partial [Sedimenticola sp.]|nr:hypothetical protein [Sedimenticola sp.]
IKEWLAKDREKFGLSFDKGMAEVGSFIARLEQDPIANKIKTFRDKYLAHLEMTPLGEDRAGTKISDSALRWKATH